MISFIENVNKLIENVKNDQQSFSVSYLTPNRPSNHTSSVPSRTVRYPLVVKTEKLETVFNKKTIYFWLNTKYPQRLFSVKDVEKCYELFSLFLKKTNTMDGDTGYREFYYSWWHLNYGIFTEQRAKIISELFSQNDIRIICYNVDELDQKYGFINTFSLPLEEKKQHMDLLEFSLIEVLENDWAYDVAIKYLHTIPDFETIYNILHNHLKLSHDIICYIYKFLDDSPSP